MGEKKVLGFSGTLPLLNLTVALRGWHCYQPNFKGRRLRHREAKLFQVPENNTAGTCWSQNCCYCLLVKSCPTILQPHGLWPARLLCLWVFSRKNTEVRCHFLLQGIFPTQGSNLCLLRWQADSLPLDHQGSPKPEYLTTNVYNQLQLPQWAMWTFNYIVKTPHHQFGHLIGVKEAL